MPALERTRTGLDLGLRSTRTTLLRGLLALGVVGGAGAIGIASEVAALSGAFGFLGGLGTLVFAGLVPIASVVGGSTVADRALDRLVRSELERCNARGARAMLDRVHREDLVCIQGRVKGRDTVAGRLDPAARSILRQTWLMVGGEAVVNEVGEDFTLAEESGRLIPVFVASAAFIPTPIRFSRCSRRQRRLLDDLLERIRVSPATSFEKERLTAGEAYLRAGDEVTVFGNRSHVVDPTVTERLSRDVPLRTVVGSAEDRPVLVIASPGGRIPRYLRLLVGPAGGIASQRDR